MRSIKENKSTWKYTLVLFLFMVMIFWKLFLTPGYSMMTYFDNANQSYPWFQYMAYALHQGSFPFWDIFTDAGRPFIGEAQTGAFYPFNLIMAIMPLNSKGSLPVVLIEGFVALHCFLASFLMFRLALTLNLSPFCALVSGLTYAYCGSVGMRAFGQINIFYGVVWVPAVFLFFLKALQSRRISRLMLNANLAGLSLGLSFLAGHHQPFFYTGIAVVFSAAGLWILQTSPPTGGDFWGIGRRRILWVTVLIFLFAFCYVSLQFFPSWEYAHHAYRWFGEQSDLASKRLLYFFAGSQNLLSPGGLIATVFPYLYPTENNPYWGILPLFFAVISLKEFKRSPVVKWAWCLAVLFFLLALGRWSPLHGLFYLLVPQFDKGRAPGRALVIFHLAMSLLAGFGAQLCFRPLRKVERWMARRWYQFLLSLFLVLSLIVFATYLYRVPGLSSPDHFDGLFFTLLLMLASSGVFFFRYYSVFSPNSLRSAVVIILLFDFSSFFMPHFRLKSDFDKKQNLEPLQYYPRDEVIKFLQARPSPFRVDLRNKIYPGNSGEVYKLETINSYGATRVTYFFDYLLSGFGPGSRFADLLNVKYVVAYGDFPMPKLFEVKGVKVYENPNCLPRAWMVQEVGIQPSDSVLMTQIQDGSFQPRQRAVIDEQPQFNQGRTGRRDPSSLPEKESKDEVVKYQRLSPNRFVVEVQAPSAAYLVVSETWYPGWRATVQGQDRKLYRTDGTLMGLWVVPGYSKVDFCFRPTHLTLGLALTSLGLICLLAACFASRRVSSDVQVQPS